MTTQLRRPFAMLLVLLLALGALVAPSTPALPMPPLSAQAAQGTIPDGLMTAFLAASSQPFTPSTDGYHAHSGGLDVILDASGLQAKLSGLAWRIALHTWGREGEMTTVPEVTVAQAGDHLEYRRGVLTEWYRDTPLGVEQGFTIHQPPRGAGALVLQLDLSTKLPGALDADGRGLSFAAPDGQTLRYDHLRAWDADDTPLEARLSLTAGQVTLHVDDRRAAYPITIDPLIYGEQTRLAAPDGEAVDYFAHSLALWGDTALVGAIYDDVGTGMAQGSVYVFTRSGTTWSQQQKLTASDGEAGDVFGWSVALWGDTALIGADHDTVGENDAQGSAYVFTRDGSTWTEQAHLTASDGEAGDYFGHSVALWGDTALVGAVVDDVGANAYQGSAYVFTRSGTAWSEQAHLTASDGETDDGFGHSVALWGDTALVGAVYDNAVHGSAYVFVQSGTTWSEQAHLTASDGQDVYRFGWSVALWEDTALVGAVYEKVGPNFAQGAAYLFARNGTAWSEQARLAASDGEGDDQLGYSVAIWGDTALVGAFGDDVGENSAQGSAYVFVRSGTTWSEQAHLTASDGTEYDHFGYSVAIWENTAVVGAPSDDESRGSAYVYESHRIHLPLVLRRAP